MLFKKISIKTLFYYIIKILKTTIRLEPLKEKFKQA